MKKYTKEQIKELKENPYTLQIDEQRIFFTVEFKKVFWTKYQAGMSPRKILKDLNYNLEYFGQKQIDSITQRIKKEYYNGPANIKERIDLGTEVVEEERSEYVSRTTYHIKNIVIYDNGMPILNDGYVSLTGIKIPESKQENKVRVRKRHRPKRRSNKY